MQLESYGKSITIVNNKVKDLDEHHINYDGKRAKIKARKNNKLTYARLTPKHVKKLFKKSRSKKSLQENLESLLKNKRRKTKKRRKRKKRGPGRPKGSKNKTRKKN